MGRFNEPSTINTRTTNLAGGSAFVMTPELELVTFLLTNFLNDQFYRSGKTAEKGLKKLVAAVDAKFAAQAAIYARNEFGMRTVTHAVAGEIAGVVKGAEWTKRFFDKVVRRPDDMTEILAYYYANYGKNEPNALRKGFAKALERFDEYQLAKYRNSKNAVSLVDIVNLVHPAHTDAIGKLVRDELRNEDTFESKLSKAGQSEDSEKAKGEAWAELVNSGKISYFALLRNLRNIIQDAPEVTEKAVALLTDRKRIQKSLVLPFRYLSAIDEIEKLSGRESKEVIRGLNRAIDISTSNVPKFDGETLVAVDTSGSMYGGYGSGNVIRKASQFWLRATLQT
jgi:60 kDa SS-A/Ro ribonucleoprotein